MKILFSSDHGGLKLKEYLISYLKSLGIFEIQDFGPTTHNPIDDYPDFVIPMVKQLQLDTKNQRGVAICRNGVGVSMTANKYRGVRAALVATPEQAKTARTDDNSNVLCLPADFIDNNNALEILNTWLGTEFDSQTRHLRRLNKIDILGTGYSNTVIIPSIFEESLEKIKTNVKKAEKYFDLIQIDFADGNLVDGKTYLDMYEVGKIKTTSKVELHLMLENPLMALNNRIPNVTKICTQVEANNLNEFIKKSNEFGYLVGISIDVETDFEAVESFIKKIDYVQFMTVKAGGSGRDFEKKVLNKIMDFKLKHPEVPTQVDGHINTDTINIALQHGANYVAPNSALFIGDIEKNIINLLKKANNYEH